MAILNFKKIQYFSVTDGPYGTNNSLFFSDVTFNGQSITAFNVNAGAWVDSIQFKYFFY